MYRCYTGVSCYAAGCVLLTALLSHTGTVTAEIVAYWPFEPDDLTVDASGNGNTLLNAGVVAGDPSPAPGSTGSAEFSSTNWLQTLAPLNLVGYDEVRISWWQKVASPFPTTQIIWEHSANYNLTDYGLLAAVSSQGAGTGEIGQQWGSLSPEPGRFYNIDFFEHDTSSEWQHMVVEFDHTVADPADMIRIFVDGVPANIADPRNDAEPLADFTNDVFHIGARGGGFFGIFGNMDDMMIEGFSGTTGLPGDHNGDGKVDAADYVAWRDDPSSFGGDPGGYNAWRANFGLAEGSGTGIGDGATVPEPTSFVLAFVMATALLSFHRRSERRFRKVAEIPYTNP